MYQVRSLRDGLFPSPAPRTRRSYEVASPKNELQQREWAWKWLCKVSGPCRWSEPIYDVLYVRSERVTKSTLVRGESYQFTKWWDLRLLSSIQCSLRAIFLVQKPMTGYQENTRKYELLTRWIVIYLPAKNLINGIFMELAVRSLWLWF